MYIIQSLIGGFVILWGVGGYLKWYFYIQRRDRAKEWKCQPDRFLSPEDDRLEFWLGSMNMAIGSVLSGNGLFIHYRFHEVMAQRACICAQCHHFRENGELVWLKMNL